MAMTPGFGWNIGGHQLRIPVDHRGLYPENMGPNTLARYLKGIRRHDVERGNINANRPWNPTHGNNPMKFFDWRDNYRQREKDLVNRARISNEFRVAEENMKKHKRKQALEGLDSETQRKMREQWRREDEYEEAQNALQSLHAKSANNAALRKSMAFPGKKLKRAVMPSEMGRK